MYLRGIKWQGGGKSFRLRGSDTFLYLSRDVEMGGACSEQGGMCTVLVRKSERKREHGRPRSRWIRTGFIWLRIGAGGEFL